MQNKNSDGSFTFMGGITRVERREVNTANGLRSVANFSLAVHLNKDDTPKYAECVAWGKLADCICSYNKGDVVSVTGVVSKREYTGKDGTQKVQNVCNVQGIVNGCCYKSYQSQPSFSQQSNSFAPAPVPQQSAPDNKDAFVEVADDDLPF